MLTRIITALDKKETNKKVYNFLIIFIAAFPLIGMRTETYIITAWCLFSIILTFKNRSYNLVLKDKKSFLILNSYYLMALLSFFIFSLDSHQALKDLETKALFIIFPTIFYFSQDFINKKTLGRALLSFASSNILLAAYVWVIIFKKGFMGMLKLDHHYNPVFRNVFSNTTQAHLPYLGLLFGFSCVIMIHFLLKNKTHYILRIIIGFSIFLLLFSMMIFSARMAIFATIISSLMLFKSLNKKQIMIGLASVSIIVLILFFLPPSKRRISELSQTEFVLPNKTQSSKNVNFRYGTYYCSMEVLKINWLFGLGLGNVQKQLDQCYQGFDYENFDDFGVRKYNSHNQYLNAWLTFGILGLGVFIYFLYYSFSKTTILHKSFLVLSFLALLTENLFEREIGVMLFTFFNTLFFVSTRKIKST